jgi:hypothetical protein
MNQRPARRMNSRGRAQLFYGDGHRWGHPMKMARTAKKIVLPGGLTILHEKNPISKAFCVGVWTRTGARDEKPREAGLCHFLEHMLFKGTARRSAKDISQEIEKIGGCPERPSADECHRDVASRFVRHSTAAMTPC